MSTPPSYTDRPVLNPRTDINTGQHHPPLFISYVTGTRAGTGEWTTRVSRPLDPSVVNRTNSGALPEAGNISARAAAREAETGYSDRRVTLPLALSPPVTSVVSRYSTTRGRESEVPRAEKMASRDAGKKPESTTSNGTSPSDRMAYTTLRQLWNSVESPSRLGTAPRSGIGRQTEEQILKGIVMDYLSHERFPNTVGVLLGARPPSDEDQDIDLPIVGAGKGKAREDGSERQDEDVQMVSDSSTFLSHSTSSQKTVTRADEGKQVGKIDVESFVKQIEWRKEIREMILEGRITTATDLIRKHFPSLLDTSRDGHTNGFDEDDEDMEDASDEEDDISSVERCMARKCVGDRTARTNGNPATATATTSPAVTNSRPHRPLVNVTGFAAGPSGNAARGGAGSRFGLMTRASGSNGTSGATAGSTGDVQWTAHPRTASTGPSISTIPDPLPELTVPDFPYAHTYDRPTLLALNLDIQEFVESLRVLQQQVPSSPSEAVSLSNSMYDEATGGTGGRPMDDHAMTSRPATPNPPAAATGAATRKAARDAAILACLAHAARLDTATRQLRPRESRRYAQQVQDVCGLLAYTDMEASPLAGYLEQERRTRLADLVEGCIMACLGYPPQSVLETLWQHDAYLWHPEYGHLATHDLKLENEDAEEGDEGKKMRDLAMDLLYYEPVMRLS